jgi:glycosyltransferase involved in cell wall biosynthesis
MSPAILLVARHYPPSVSGGARRPALLAAGLRERGWTVHVASPYAPMGEPDWIETLHPAGLRGDKASSTPTPPLQRWTEEAKSHLRQALYWPDGDMRWGRSVAHAVRHAGVKPDIVLTTSPPESAHLAGPVIKREHGAAWIAELRDSWIEDPLRGELKSSAMRRKLERRIAKALLSQADHVVAVSEAIGAEVLRLAGDECPPVSVIGHFARASSRKYTFAGEGPYFLHSGRFTLSHPERRIELVLEAFAKARVELPNASLHLVGRLTQAEIETVSARPDAAHITLHGEVDYDTALSMQGAADGLVLFQQGTSALPGKLSEYLLTRVPILVVGDGPWRARLADLAHYPLESAALALSAPKRSPSDSMGPAIELYERILRATLARR